MPTKKKVKPVKKKIIMTNDEKKLLIDLIYKATLCNEIFAFSMNRSFEGEYEIYKHVPACMNGPFIQINIVN